MRDTPGIGTVVVYDPAGRRIWTLDESLFAGTISVGGRGWA
jgi:hypothetical protein